MTKGVQEQLQELIGLCGYPVQLPPLDRIKEINAYLYLDKKNPRVRIKLTKDLQSIIKKEKLRFDSLISTGSQWQFDHKIKRENRADRWKERNKLNTCLKSIFEILPNKETVAILGAGCEPDKLQNVIEEGIEHIGVLKKLKILPCDITRSLEDRGLSTVFMDMIDEPDSVMKDLGKILNKFEIDVFSENWTRKLKKIRGVQHERVRYFYHNDFKISKLRKGKGDKYSINIELALLAYRCTIEYFSERTSKVKFIVVAGYKPEIFKVATFMCGAALLHNQDIRIIILRRELKEYPELESWINTIMNLIKEHIFMIEKYIAVDEETKRKVNEKIKNLIVYFPINEKPDKIREIIKKNFLDKN